MNATETETEEVETPIDEFPSGVIEVDISDMIPDQDEIDAVLEDAQHMIDLFRQHLPEDQLLLAMASAAVVTSETYDALSEDQWHVPAQLLIGMFMGAAFPSQLANAEA